MACSKPETNISVQTEVHVLGKTEVEWKIVGNGGPLWHLMRDRGRDAWFVNVPVDNNPASDIKLRFFLKPYKCHKELTERFSSQENITELLPQTGHPYARCSLLVDVLSRHENLTLNVAVKKLEEQQQTVANNIVNLDPFSGRENIVVMPNFWTADERVDISHCQSTFVKTMDHARFHLTITAYDLTSTVTGGTTPDVVNETKNEGNIPLNHETLFKSGCLNVLKVRSFFEFGAPLAENSAALLRNFARKSKQIFQSVYSNLLKAVVVWIVIAACIACTWNSVKVNENHKTSTSSSDIPAQKMSRVSLNLEIGSSQKNVDSSKSHTTEIKGGLISIFSCERLNERANGRERLRHVRVIKKLEDNIKNLKEQLKKDENNNSFANNICALLVMFIFTMLCLTILFPPR